MIDVKKFISGFLILAAAAVGSGFILSFIDTQSSAPAGANSAAQPKITGIGDSNGQASGSALPGSGSAFVDTGSLSGNAAELLSQTQTTSTAMAASDPNNITNAFADSILNGLVGSNPDGAVVDSNGSPVFNAPDSQAVATAISANAAIKNFHVPNWDIEAQSQVIKTTNTSSPSDISQYGSAVNAVFNKYLAAGDLQTIVYGQNSDPSQAAYVTAQFKGALSELLAVPVPKSLAGLQRSMVRVLVYEKNMAQLVQNSSIDPVKSALTLQGEQDKYSAAVTELQSQMTSAASLGLAFGNHQETGGVPWIAQLLGVQPAHALFGVGDITFDPAVFAQIVLGYVKDTVVQILKNALVSMVQQKVLSWVQGSGAPRFVTNFATELINSYQTAAINRLNTLMACVPQYQAPSVRILISTPSTALKNSCSEEFNGQLNNNLQNFYNHFDNFTNYLSLFRPGGNVWSLTIQLQDNAIAAGGQSQQTQQTKIVSQQAWKGAEKCADGSDPNGEHYYCEDGTKPDANGMCGTGTEQTFALVAANNGKCSNGDDPKTVTPGQVTGQGFFTALKSSVENITSAQNIAGILNALLSSLLNTLAQNAIDASNQLVNNGLSGSGGSSDPGIIGTSGSNIGSGGSSSQAGVQCSPSTQPAFISTSTNQATVNLSAAGGAIDTACAANKNCPITENSDGTPHYYWLAPGAITNNASGSAFTALGDSISASYSATGTYFVTVKASTDDSTSTCEVDVQ